MNKLETIEKVLIVFGILLFLALLLSLKFFGVTEVPKLVEQDGFCKIQFGDGWKFNEQGNYCYGGKDEIKTFTEVEFRKVCPRVNFFELRFYSDCFNKGYSG